MNHLSNYTMSVFAIVNLMLMTFSLTSDLSKAIAQMEKGNSLIFEYNCEGCYGP